MKIIFKIFTLIVFASLLLSIACKKHDCMKPKAALTDAIITGNDLRACACCGGLMITFTNNSTPYTEKFYTIEQLPANSGITESSSFPINVKVNYENVSSGCPDQLNILIIEKR